MFRLNAELVRDLLFQRRWSFKQLAEHARLNEYTVRKCLRDGASVTARTLAALAAVFGVRGDELTLKE